MPAAPAPLAFNTRFDAQTGQAVDVAPGVVRVTASNASPYTFTGTNSFIIGRERVAVVDPGPDDERHLASLVTAIAGRPVEAIILTHTHIDHSALARRLATKVAAPLWFGGQHRLSRPLRPFEINPVAKSSDWDLMPDRVLADGEVFRVDGIEIEAIATPGHCANHFAFGFYGTPQLLSGDHVMGWNSTLVSVPDGSMSDYFRSLDRLLALPYRHYLPAHGGPIEDGPGHTLALKAHREARNRQIVEAVASGVRSRTRLLPVIYPGLAIKLLPAAAMTLKAHVEYLAERGEIRVERRGFGQRLLPA